MVGGEVVRLQQRHRGELGCGQPVGGGAVGGGLPASRLVDPRLPAGADQARHQPHQIPVPGADDGLVEVVDIHHLTAFRGGVEAEVGRVGVTTDPAVQATVRAAGEVGGHHGGGAAQEGERGAGHPPHPDRHQVGQPLGIRRCGDPDGGPAAGIVPACDGDPGGRAVSAATGACRRAAAPCSRKAATGLQVLTVTPEQ